MREHILKIFTANRFEGNIDGMNTYPPKQSVTKTSNVSSNSKYTLSHLIDRNLEAAIYSTVSQFILPYMLNLRSTIEIWQTLEKRLQPTN